MHDVMSLSCVTKNVLYLVLEQIWHKSKNIRSETDHVPTRSFPTYLGLSEKCTLRRCSRTSLTNHNSGRTACPMGWKASAGSQGSALSLTGWPHSRHNSTDNPAGQTQEKRCRWWTVNSSKVKQISWNQPPPLWDKLDQWWDTVRDLQVERRGGGPAQCAGLLRQWHTSGWAGRGPFCLGRSRWGWQHSETETKPTGCCAEAAFLKRKNRRCVCTSWNLSMKWSTKLICYHECHVVVMSSVSQLYSQHSPVSCSWLSRW